MTTIVCKDNVMASDSLVTGGGIREGKAKKIHRLSNGGIAGFAGQLAFMKTAIDLLEKELIESEEFEGYPEGEYSLLYLSPNKTLHLNECGHWLDADQPYAIGSGSHVAYGALDMGANAGLAVQVAIGRDVSSGGVIQIERLSDYRLLSVDEALMLEEPILGLGDER